MAAMVEAPAPVHNVGTDGQSYYQQAPATTPQACLNVTAPTLAAVDPKTAPDGLPQLASPDTSLTPTAPVTPPPAPNPSQDEALIPHITSPKTADAPSPPALLGQAGEEPEWDVAAIPPETAMKMLARAIESLAKVTGDIPATPAASIFSKFSIGGVLGSSTPPRQGQDKENEPPAEAGRRRDGEAAPAVRDYRPSHSRNTSRPHTPTPVPDTDLRRPSFQPVTLTSPEASAHEPPLPPIPTQPAEEEEEEEGGETEGAGGEPPRRPEERQRHRVAVQRDAQTAAIARKFFSKSIPPIAIDAYLARLQRYCPMSTAVWLAAAHYIAALALPAHDGDQPLVPLTPRTTHRLLLAALRVAMKALEDLRYPQVRFAGVGGVSETELKALEISVCYLMDFELQVDVRRLLRGAVRLQRATRLAEQMRAGSAAAAASQREFVLNKDALPLRMRQAREKG